MENNVWFFTRDKVRYCLHRRDDGKLEQRRYLPYCSTWSDPYGAPDQQALEALLAEILLASPVTH